MTPDLDVLLVEDSPTQAMRLQGFLQGRGLTVHIANDASEALAFLAEQTPRLIVCDVVLPGVEGVAFCRQIRADVALPRIPIILWTKLDSPDEIERLSHADADELVRKALGDEVLLEAVHRLLTAPSARTGRTVLIVEDSATQAAQLEQTLRNAGYTTSVAADGREALALVREQQPSLVLSDIRMPMMNGVELCRALKQDPALQGIPFIVLTALSSPTDVLSALEAGADFHIPKPYDEGYLLSKVDAVLSRKHVTAPDASLTPPTTETIVFKGISYRVSASRYQALQLLLSTYEVAIQQNLALQEAREALLAQNATLEARVRERTEALRKEAVESQRLRDALDRVPSHIFMKDAQSRYVYANRATLDNFGCGLGALIGRSDDDFFPAPTASVLHAIDARVLAGTSTLEEVVVNERDHGDRVYIEEKTPVYADASHREICGLCGIATDITERKRTEEALRESEYFFRESQRLGHVGSYRLDLVAGRWKSSTVLDDIFGIDERYERTVAGWMALVHPDDCAIMMKYLQDGPRAAGSEFDQEYRIIRKSDADVRWLHARGAIERGEDGAVVAMAGTVQDITERKDTEAILAQMNRQIEAKRSRLASLLTSMPDEVWYCNPEHEFSLINAAGLQEFKLDGSETIRVEELEGACDVRRADGTARSVAESPSLRALAGEVVGPEEELVRTPSSGEWRHRQVRAVPVHDDGGRIIGSVSVVRDITEQKRTEAALRRNENWFRSLNAVLQCRAETPSELLDFALAEGIELTQSRFGYLYVYDERQGKFILSSCCGDVMQRSTAADPRTCYDLAETGLWGEAVRLRRPIVLNDFATQCGPGKTFPEGHASVHRYLAVPVSFGERVVAVIGVANKAVDYDDTDIDQLKVLTDAAWSMAEERKAQAALGASEERFRRAVVDAPFPIMLHAEDGQILQVNNAFCELSGYGPEELATVADWIIHLGREHSSMQAQVERIYDLTHRESEGEVEVHTKRGETRIWDVSSAPLGPMPGHGRVVITTAVDVTDRRRSEEALRSSMARMQAITQSAHDAIITVDIAGTIVGWNLGAEQIFGLSEERAVGHSVSTLVPQRLRSELDESVKLIRDGAELSTLANAGSLIGLRADGTEFPLDLSMARWKSADSWFCTAIVRDTTERSRAEEALRESEGRFRAIFQEAPLGIALIESETGKIQTLNQRFAEIAGRSVEELSAMNLVSLTHADDVPEVAEKTAELNAGAISRFHVRERLVRPDRSNVWISMTVAPVVVQGGCPMHLAMIEDIGARMAAEEELAKLSRAVDQSQANIVITDVHAHIEYVNESFVRRTGYARQEVLGRNPRILQSGETPPATYTAMWKTLSRGDIWTGEFINRRKDGSTFVEVAVVSPLRNANGVVTHYVAVKEDVTEQKHLLAELAQHRDHLVDLVEERTRELVEARDQAEAANRAKSIFLSTMSHEIRTPLNGVIAMAEILALRPLAPQDMDAARTIERSAHNLLSVIDDILDFSKIEAGKLVLDVAVMSLHEVAGDVSSSLFSLAMAGDVDLKVEVAPDVPPFVRGDATRVRQILMNLAGNAIKFSRGRVDVKGEVSVRMSVASPSPLRVALRVADNGIGMTPDAISQLFTSFTQAETSTTRRFGGTGLGLAICKRLVELMEGTIEVASKPGLGATFTVTLPFEIAGAPDEASAVGADGAVSRLGDGRAARFAATSEPISVTEARALGRLVLVAEDDEMNQKVILQQLRTVGYAGEIAGDGVEALRRWRQGDYAMLLSDLHMPCMDGYDLARAIRREEPSGQHLPIIALTANALRGEAERAAIAGMDGYLTKPVPLATLRGVLDQWIAPATRDAQSPSLTADRIDTLPDRAVPMVRVSVLTRRIGSDAAAVRAGLASYLSDARTLVAQVRQCRVDGDLCKVGEFAAVLKTQSRAVGALLFGDLCAELENVAKVGNAHAVAEQLPRFEQTFASVESELEQLLHAPGTGRKPS